ncbi:MAG: organic hydroperoxide resistance protein [Xanthomonadales bacterium]|nr:Organic hydroperoxide resistance protein OhrB [Xanthomonadales bacterium]MCC6594416.1 organic hydroperoxide resistance protein [Xanthomonadales bacterium]MCE7931625.1 organic hydroperoxide resistance protein [Xanthomonadales bacterium PRO6]
MQPLYTAKASAIAGRDGRVGSDDGLLDFALTVPRGLGGPGGHGTNPEQLFACGYSACFGGALKLVAGMQKVTTGPVTIHAEVTIGKDTTGYGLSVKLTGHMPQLAVDQAMALMQAAHQVCPYSKATRGNIEVELAVA